MAEAPGKKRSVPPRAASRPTKYKDYELLDYETDQSENPVKPRATASRNSKKDGDEVPKKRISLSRLEIMESQLKNGTKAPSPEKEPPPPEAEPNGSSNVVEDLPQNPATPAVEVKASGKEEEVPSSFHNQKLSDFMKKYGAYKKYHPKHSVSEISDLVLSLSITENLTLQTTGKVFKILNQVLGTKAFPGSAPKVKALFNPGIDMQLHFTCERCGLYLGGGPKQEAVKCPKCFQINNIFCYKHNDSFMTFDIKSQIKSLYDIGALQIKTGAGAENGTAGDGVYRDIQDGAMYKKIMQHHVPKSDKEIVLTCIFNADRTPLARGSKATSVTPLSLKINEASLNFRGKNLLLAALHYGKKKPVMEILLKPFVDVMKDLYQKGFELEVQGQSYTFRIIVACCCVDATSRASMQGIVGAGKYFACSWCLIKGVSCEGKVKYPKRGKDNSYLSQPELRTEQNFYECCDKLFASEFKEPINGLRIVTPLTNLPQFDPVSGFVPDYNVPLEVTQRLLNLWLSTPDKHYFIGKPDDLTLMDTILSGIQPPKLIKRLPLPISDIANMKARDTENWLLFYSVPILESVLPWDCYVHWLKLVGAMQLLLQDEVTKEEIKSAEDMLEGFSNLTEIMYGEAECTFSNHQIAHMAEACRMWGPLWAHNTFSFKDFVGDARTAPVRAGFPRQIVKNLNFKSSQAFMANYKGGDQATKEQLGQEIEANKGLTFRKTKGGEVLLGKPSSMHLLEGNCIQTKKILAYDGVIKDGITFSKAGKEDNPKKRSFDNSYVILDNGDYARIEMIYVFESAQDDVIVYVQRYKCELIGSLKYTKKITGTVWPKKMFPVREIKCAAVYVKKDVNNVISEYITAVPKKYFTVSK